MKKKDETKIDPLWNLAEILSLEDAAALIAGYDPGKIKSHRKDKDFEKNYAEVHIAETALVNAVQGGLIDADIRYYHTESPLGIFTETDDIMKSETKINTENIRTWLKKKGRKEGFFFNPPTDSSDFFNKNGDHYAPKLAAAARAWQAVNSDPSLVAGKSVKQALEKWLEDNADEFGLKKKNGALNKQGIDEIAKIANWKLTGGAPTTPS